MLKVLLGKGAKDDRWRFYGENRTHDLTLLYDKLGTQDPDVATRLDDVFQQVVMVHGNPTFGDFLNPQSTTASGGLRVTISTDESIEVPGARCLRDHLELMSMNSVHSQAYLGDAVQRISSAYLNYLADAVPFLDFLGEAMRDVVMPAVGHHLYR